MGFTIPVYLVGPGGHSDDGQMYIGSCKTRMDKPAWRAVLKIKNVENRIYGNMLPTKMATAIALIDREPGRFGVAERDRIRQVILAHESSGQEPCGSGQRLGSQPTDEATALRQLGSSPNVSRVHQIYGLFRDDKPMPALFQQSRDRWQQVATDMQAHYHLWSADEVDTLVREHYSKYLPMYLDARYPVMRADIGRVAILHRYGGLYADLDVMPNRPAYQQATLAVSIVPDKNPGRHYLDMELLIARAGNPILLAWLDHMGEEITTKPYTNKNSFWFGAKMRYIYHTTGPHSMARFLRLPANKDVYAKLVHVSLNRPVQEGEPALTSTQKRLYEAISYHSCSYLTKAQSVSAVVSEHSVDLPSPPARIRVRAKSHADAFQTDAPGKRLRTTSTSNTEGQASGSQPTMPSLVEELAASRAENMRLRNLLNLELFGDDSDEDTPPRGNAEALASDIASVEPDGSHVSGHGPQVEGGDGSQPTDLEAHVALLTEELEKERAEHRSINEFFRWELRHSTRLNALIWEGRDTRPGGRFWAGLPEEIRDYITHVRAENVD